MLKAFRNNRPLWTVLIGAFFISFSGVWVKFAHVPPTTSAFYRVFFGFCFLLAASLWKRDFKRMHGTQVVLVCACGLFFALDLFCWHASILHIGPGLATIISNFQVFVLTSAGILFLKEKLQLRFMLSIPLAFLGLVMVIGIHWNQLGSGYRTGISLGLVTALCYSGFLLTLRKLQAEKSGFSIFFFLMLISLTTAVFLATEMAISNQSFLIPDITSWLSLLFLGLFSQTIGWVLIANALPKIQASLAGLILLLQPALAFIWDVTLFGRPTNLTNWLGALMILAAIYMGTSQPTKKDVSFS